MKKLVLLAVLLLALVFTAVACDKTNSGDDTTVADTTIETPTEEATTEAPTEEATTEEATTEEATTEEATTEEATTEEATTEEATTEEPTTEEATTEEPTEPAAPRYDDYNVPQDQWTVSGHKAGVTPAGDATHGGMVAAGGLEAGALLHQGAIGLGVIDLSIYDKVLVYCGCDASGVTQGHYDANTNNRIILTKVDTDGNMSPNEEDIIASVTYTLHGWAPEAVEIDLSGIDYNGPVYVTYDTLPGTFMLVGAVEFIGAELPAPAEPYEVDLSTVTATGSYPEVDVPINAGALGLTSGHVITLHYGSINLGEMDLSKYSKVTVTYATPCGVANGQDMNAEYEATGKRVLLLNAPSAVQDGTPFEYLPAEDAIITTTHYDISPVYAQLMTVEIDLTNVDYNGQVILSFDARNANNEFGALGYLVFVTGITFQ